MTYLIVFVVGVDVGLYFGLKIVKRNQNKENK